MSCLEVVIRLDNADDPEMAGPEVLFYSSDGGETPHVHVDHGGRTIKVWLGTLKVACNDGYSMREVAAILDVVDRNRERLVGAW